MIYYPDRWLVLKFTIAKETFYKLFTTWSGGYCQGDSWKLNSGIKNINITEERIEFYGKSGSIYSCNFGAQGNTLYGSGVLSNLVEQASTIGINIETVLFEEVNELLKILDSSI